MKAANRDVKSKINKATRETMNPVWKDVVSSHMSGTSLFVSKMLNNGVRISAGNPPAALAAQSKRGLGKTKRLVPQTHYALAEFGVGNREAYSTYDRRGRKSGTHKVTRRVRRGLPTRVPKGRAVYPAFGEIGPRMVSLWTQLIVKTYWDAAEGKGG